MKTCALLVYQFLFLVSGSENSIGALKITFSLSVEFMQIVFQVEYFAVFDWDSFFF